MFHGSPRNTSFCGDWCYAGYRWGCGTAVNTREGMTDTALCCLEDDVSASDASVVSHSMVHTRRFHTGALTALVVTATGHRTCWPFFSFDFSGCRRNPVELRRVSPGSFSK